ncbi:MAG: ABC transporter permease subunit [Synergistaceae bacterium]|jgi:phosphate transport system permease protein|nr:ABC transporter permease subunit [Synergistaceae bacterium]
MHQTSASFWLRVLALSVGALLSTMFAFIFFSATEALWVGRGLSLFGAVWSPQRGKFGIAAMIHASFLLSLSALCLGWLLSLGCCCVLRGLGPRWLSAVLNVALRFMTAVPTVVYGFTAVFLLVPLIRDALGGSGFCWLAAGVMLAFQGIPTMTVVMDGAMRTIEAETSLTAAALGMNPIQNLNRVVIPASRSWLLSAAILGFGRALGDALLPTMLAGNAVQFASTPLDSMRSLTAHISLVLSSNIGGGENLSLLLAGGLLLAGSAAVSLLALFSKQETHGR